MRSKFRVARIWALNPKAMDEKFSFAKAYTTQPKQEGNRTFQFKMSRKGELTIG